MIISAIINQVKSPPPLTEADLRPGRYADHAMFERAGSLLAWILLGTGAGFAALSRYRHGRDLRSQSAGLLDLLRASDWLWVIVGGILIPALWYFAITRLTPLSAREWSIHMEGFSPAAGQLASFAMLTLILPVILARWRVAKRGGDAGLTTCWPWIAWLAVAAAALALPVFGAILPGPKEELLNTGAILLGVAVLWLLVGFARNVFGKQRHALRRITLARMVLPAWIFGMLVFALSVPLHYAAECHWIQRDHILEISAAAPSVSCYEYQVARQLRIELLEMIAAAKQDR